MYKILKKDIDNGKTEVDIKRALKSDIITRGLRTALATGNWGRDKNGDVLKTGVA
jgi:DNA-directed RNA polymerase II subunit RPB2